ncbi:MAG: hypothetical protein C0421_08575 [Hyphomonas sp.]|uniref:hypothetical protein n=1 Tax=Hyphomonas sp. TaxID=87 RepID=UPI0025BC337C|nr:hypothetical protein [Hyphomonas sp.]MBA4338885.1 hypothetical protein [Hyphomonas sp.]
MTDRPVLTAPPAREPKLKAPRTGLIARWLAWSSLHLPGFWRLRVDIALPMQIGLMLGALAAPFLFLWMSGVDGHAYCGTPGPNYPSADDPANAVCVDYVRFSDYIDQVSYTAHQYTYGSGFSNTDLSQIVLLFVLASFALAMTWLYYVCRGVRLRDVVPVNDQPALLPIVVLLCLFNVWPVLALHSAFAFTHGGGLGTLLTGAADITRDDGQLRTIYAPRDASPAFSFGFLVFGLVLSLLISIATKLLIFDGLIGLLRAFVVAVLAGTVTALMYFIDAATMRISFNLIDFGQSNDLSNNVYAFVLCSLPSAAFLYLAHQKDVWRGVRRPETRTFAMAFALYTPVWLFFAIYGLMALIFVDRSTGLLSQPIVVMALCLLAVAVISALILRGIARLSLLPRP